MSANHPPRIWLDRLVNIFAVVTIIVALVVVGGFIWIQWSLSSHFSKMEEADTVKMAQYSVKIQSELRAATSDGKLTDIEINEAAGRRDWHSEKTPERLRLTVRMDGTTMAPDRCFTYDFDLPIRKNYTPIINEIPPIRKDVVPSPNDIPECTKATHHPDLRPTG